MGVWAWRSIMGEVTITRSRTECQTIVDTSIGLWLEYVEGGEVQNLFWRWALISVALLLTGLLGENLKVGLDLTEHAVWKLPLAGLLVGLVNALVLPLLRLVTLPLHCATLGLSTLLVNAALFYWVGHLGLGLEVVTFWGALFGTLCVSVISTALGFLLPDRKE